MDENPYRAPKTPPKEPSVETHRFGLRHVPIVIALFAGLFILFKLLILFIELGIELVK